MKIVRDAAGTLTMLMGRTVAIHFWIKKDTWEWHKKSGHRCWGYEKDWYDGPLYSFGLGRFVIITWA